VGVFYIFLGLGTFNRRNSEVAATGKKGGRTLRGRQCLHILLREQETPRQERIGVVNEKFRTDRKSQTPVKVLLS